MWHNQWRCSTGWRILPGIVFTLTPWIETLTTKILEKSSPAKPKNQQTTFCFMDPRKSKDQTLPIGSRESFTWIILKTILCLVLDFQGDVWWQKFVKIDIHQYHGVWNHHPKDRKKLVGKISKTVDPVGQKRWIRRTWAIGTPNPTVQISHGKRSSEGWVNCNCKSWPKGVGFLPQKTMTWGWLALATGNYADLRGRFENDFPGALLWQIGAPL